MTDNSLVSEWIRRTSLPETVEELLPTHDPQLSSWEWRTPLHAGANHQTVLKFPNVSYEVLLKLVPSMNSPVSLELYYKHTSIQVRRAVCANPAASPEQRAYLLRWAIGKKDAGAVGGLSKSMTLEQLDSVYENYPDFRSVITPAWCAALVKDSRNIKRVVDSITRDATVAYGDQTRLNILITSVVAGRVDGLTITELLAQIEDRNAARMVASIAFAVARRMTREIAEMAITHLNGSDIPSLNLPRFNTSAGSVSCSMRTCDEDAVVHVAEHAESKLLYNVVEWIKNGSCRSSAAIDALLDTCERATVAKSAVDRLSAGSAASKMAVATYATAAQRNRAALLVNTLATANSLLGLAATPDETCWLRELGDVVKRESVLEPDVVLTLMPAFCASQTDAFEYWIFHQTECYEPSDAIVMALLQEVARRRWGPTLLAAAMETSSLDWRYMSAKTEILDLILDSIGPKALSLNRDPVIDRVVQRLDKACEGRPETALSIASLMTSSWESSLAQLIETGLLLSGHTLDEVGVECRLVQPSLF